MQLYSFFSIETCSKDKFSITVTMEIIFLRNSLTISRRQSDINNKNMETGTGQKCYIDDIHLGVMDATGSDGQRQE